MAKRTTADILRSTRQTVEQRKPQIVISICWIAAIRQTTLISKSSGLRVRDSLGAEYDKNKNYKRHSEKLLIVITHGVYLNSHFVLTRKSDRYPSDGNGGVVSKVIDMFLFGFAS